MKSQLKAKLLQHFAGKKANGGFTLIELLVVIIIIGILSAIALPSFLNQANKAKQSEAKTYVGSMNRGQQAYYLENDTFAPNLTVLGLGIDADTDAYDYATVGGTTAFNTGVPKTAASSVKAYAGGVEIVTGTSVAILCEALLAPVEDATNGNTVTTALAFDATNDLDSSDTNTVACNATNYDGLN